MRILRAAAHSSSRPCARSRSAVTGLREPSSVCRQALSRRLHTCAARRRRFSHARGCPARPSAAMRLLTPHPSGPPHPHPSLPCCTPTLHTRGTPAPPVTHPHAAVGRGGEEAVRVAARHGCQHGPRVPHKTHVLVAVRIHVARRPGRQVRVGVGARCRHSGQHAAVGGARAARPGAGGVGCERLARPAVRSAAARPPKACAWRGTPRLAWSVRTDPPKTWRARPAGLRNALHPSALHATLAAHPTQVNLTPHSLTPPSPS
jgi:hypothetical protein